MGLVIKVLNGIKSILNTTYQKTAFVTSSLQKIFKHFGSKKLHQFQAKDDNAPLSTDFFKYGHLSNLQLKDMVRHKFI